MIEVNWDIRLSANEFSVFLKSEGHAYFRDINPLCGLSMKLVLLTNFLVDKGIVKSNSNSSSKSQQDTTEKDNQYINN